MLNQKAAAFVPIATGWRQKSRSLFGSGADRLVPCRRETHVPYVNEARLGHFRSQVPAMVVVQAMIVGLDRRLGSVESFQTQKMKSLLHRLARWPRVAGEEEQRWWWLGPAGPGSGAGRGGQLRRDHRAGERNGVGLLRPCGQREPARHVPYGRFRQPAEPGLRGQQGRRGPADKIAGDCLGRGWHPGERGRGRTPLMWLRSTCLRRWAAGAAPRILRRRCWFKPRTRWGS